MLHGIKYIYLSMLHTDPHSCYDFAVLAQSFELYLTDIKIYTSRNQANENCQDII